MGKTLWPTVLFVAVRSPGLLLLTAFVLGSIKSVAAVAPAIVVQPQTQTALTWSNITFSVVATGAPPIACQWEKNGANLSDSLKIAGATNFSLTLSGLGPSDAGNYQAVITNNSGSVTSAVAGLTVLKPPQTGADALVLVNSGSANFLDFQHFIQPYLDNFGVPYTVMDIATNPLASSIERYALLIVGHKQFDTNQTSLTTPAQAVISTAISNGVGLVNFDPALSVAGAPRYQFIQDVFAFNYVTSSLATNVTFPATEPLAQMHYITARHATNAPITLRSNMLITGLTLSVGSTAVVLAGGKPLVATTKYGQGRAVQWASYDWMSTTVLGPIEGMDDVLWRGLVWAARKPFVIRGLPNFVTMRIDDVAGPFSWVQDAVNVGFKPFVAIFISSVSPTNIAPLRTMLTNGNVTASPHSFTGFYLIYYNYTDEVISNNLYNARQWHLTNGLPMSKVLASHYSALAPNAFPGLLEWGIEFVPIEIIPGEDEYNPPYAPWLVGGPYRLYETPQQGQVNWPTYYADWLAVPGHPELAGKFFNIYSEVRDVAACGEWCPFVADVAGSISRAVQMAKRTMDSLVMTTIFTHEQYINDVTAANWRAMLQGVTNGLASYNPKYVTLDYASQYVRATRTSRITSSQLDTASGDLTASLSGKTDLDTSLQVVVGNDSSISNTTATIPTFNGTTNITAATFLVAPVLGAPAFEAGQFRFTLTGQPNLLYTILVSTNLKTWAPVTTNNSVFLTRQITVQAAQSQSFYRAVSGSFAPAPPALLQPKASSGQFTFTLLGQANTSYIIQSSTNLDDWVPITTNFSTTASRPVSFTAPGGRVFYRALLPP